MKRTLITMLLLLLMAHTVYAQSIFNTGRERETSPDVSIMSNPNYFRGVAEFLTDSGARNGGPIQRRHSGSGLLQF